MRRVGSLVLGLLMVAGLIATAATPAESQLNILDDYTDAPASYGEARHGLITGAIPIWMGDIILGFDPDGGNQPSVGAIADDCNIPEGGLIPPLTQIPVSCLPAPLNIVNDLLSDAGNFILDDEDGVNIGPIVGGQPTAVSVATIAPGFLDAWIDWDIDGVFQASDQIFNNTQLASGQNAITFNTPNVSLAGLTYARFRYSSTPVPGPTGIQADGEVEDYAIVINQDFGDAPDDQNNANDFPTTLASNGARHRASGLRLGVNLDTEVDGVTSPNALGDDANPVGGADDEDGVTLTGPLVPNTTVGVTVQSSGTGELDAWADWNNDHDWSDIGERIFTGQNVVAGNNALSINVPAGAAVGSITTRWRLSTTGMPSFTDLAPDGEVEDHQFGISTTGALDFGDAPDSYHTTLGFNGPRHTVGPLVLGNNIDAENNGQPNATATGDDINGVPDDEDGINFADTVLVPGKTTTVEVETSGTGFLDAWVDSNHDGSFDDVDEKVVDSEVVTACGDPDNQDPPQCTGTQEVDVTVPPGNTFGPTFARFRLSSGGTNSSEGFVPDGEVEDYAVSVVLECGAVVIGDFELPFDLNCPGNGPDENGLFVGENNTDIDLNGHVISGDGLDPDRGIQLWPLIPGGRANDVTIHDGAIVDFGGGIDMTGDRLTLLNLAIERNHGIGVESVGDDLSLTNVRATDNEGDGVNSIGHNLAVSVSNLSQNEGDGLQSDGDGLSMTDTTLSENGQRGLVGLGLNAGMHGMTIDNNDLHGIGWIGDNFFITTSTVTENGGLGIAIDSRRSRVRENTVSHNVLDGIRVAGHSSRVDLNTVFQNGGDGIHVLDGVRQFLNGNSSRSNGDDGIDVEKAFRGKIIFNIVGGKNRHRGIEGHQNLNGHSNKGRKCKPAFLCQPPSQR